MKIKRPSITHCPQSFRQEEEAFKRLQCFHWSAAPETARGVAREAFYDPRTKPLSPFFRAPLQLNA